MVENSQTASPGPQAGPSTRSVHAGEVRPRPHHALIEPIFQTSTYTFDSIADVIAYEAAHAAGRHTGVYEYGRYGNPTIAAAEARLAALENAESAILLASGMGALTTTFLAYLSAGDHIVITDDSYRRTRQFCQQFLARFNVDCTVVPLGDYEALEAAIRPQTRILFSETPSNPYLRILDLERFAEIGRRRNAFTVVDATLATPLNVRPLEWGIDLVIHSATKYLGGHNDLLAGVVAGNSEMIQPLRGLVGVLGGISDPNTAYLLLRGLKTLSVRVAHQNRTAQQIAGFLKEHPAVENVWYPGLKTHPGHELACRQMQGFGGLISFTVRADLQGTYRVIDALRIPYLSPSLGGAETLVLHPALMAYYDGSPEEKAQAGMVDNLIRLAVGLEDPQDLINDLDQALQVIC